MKYLIVSDIHGSEASAEFIVNKFNEGFDKLLILGDVLYHGPRNDLPEAYRPKGVIALLNPLADKIICVKGNCEAEVDQMVLDFKIHDFYDLEIDGKKVHLEHGHHLDAYEGNADIVLSGHTHIPLCDVKGDVTYMNPGSITIPKGGFKRSYMTYIDGEYRVLTIDGELIFAK